MNPEEKAKQLAEAHWTYVRQVLELEGFNDVYTKVLGFHYTTAMIHGYKHGIADAQGGTANSQENHKCSCVKSAPNEDEKPLLFHDFQVKVLQWAQERKLLSEGTPRGQYEKLVEEVEELGEALDTSNHEATCDAIGDITVVLIILSYLGNTTITTCLSAAYNEIKNRTGQMIAGTFVKD